MDDAAISRHNALMSDTFDRAQVDRTRYAVIAATVASFAGEMAEDGTVGGFLDPDLAVQVYCEVMAALMAKSGEYAARKDRREFAEDVRKRTLVAMDAFADQPGVLDSVFEPVDPHNPPAGLPGVRGTVQ